MTVYVFDFDGVIIPSEDIKQSGYRLMFSEFGEEVPEAQISGACEESSDQRGNRYDIIRNIFERLGKTNEIDKTVEQYAQRFEDVVRPRLEALVVESSVKAVLESLSRENPLYINSNTPDEPLRATLEALGIGGLFKGVRGSSDKTTKTQRLAEIALIEDVAPHEVIFLGDGGGDRAAAREFGCTFIGVATALNGWSADACDYKVIRSLAELGDSAAPHVL